MAKRVTIITLPRLALPYSLKLSGWKINECRLVNGLTCWRIRPMIAVVVEEVQFAAAGTNLE